MELAISYYGNVPPNWHHHFVIFSMLLCLLPLYPFLGNSVGANHNKDDKSCVNNYIPISLLCCVEKVFERLIFKRQFSFRQENNVLTSFQSGFIPGDSSVSNLTCLYNVFCKVLDDGLEVRSVFFDISKAFDRVWHKGLLHKLKSTGYYYFYGLKTT